MAVSFNQLSIQASSPAWNLDAGLTIQLSRLHFFIFMQNIEKEGNSNFIPKLPLFNTIIIVVIILSSSRSLLITKLILNFMCTKWNHFYYHFDVVPVQIFEHCTEIRNAHEINVLHMMIIYILQYYIVDFKTLDFFLWQRQTMSVFFLTEGKLEQKFMTRWLLNNIIIFVLYVAYHDHVFFLLMSSS